MDEMIARHEGIPTLGPRIPIGRRVAAISEEEIITRAWNMLPTRVLGRSSSSTTDSSSSTAACSNSKANNTCEKPTSTSIATEITVAIL